MEYYHWCLEDDSSKREATLTLVNKVTHATATDTSSKNNPTYVRKVVGKILIVFSYTRKGKLIQTGFVKAQSKVGAILALRMWAGNRFKKTMVVSL